MAGRLARAAIQCRLSNEAADVTIIEEKETS
jgi:hypothetical protein